MSGQTKPKLKTPKDIGRPSKFTPERRAAIVHDIARRVPYEYAAEANGICEDTLYDWLNTGKAHRLEGIDSDYSRFSEDVKKAERDRIIGHTENIADHVDKWQGDAWLLERRWHKHFSTNVGLNELNSKMDKLMEGDKDKGENNVS